MPESLSPIIEKLETRAKELSSESLEKIQSEWKGFLTLVDQALDSPGEATKAAAKKIVQRTIDVIKKYNAPAAMALQEDLEALLYDAEQVEKFVKKLSGLSPEDLKEFMRDHLQLPELNEEQKFRVETMKIIYTVVCGCKSKASENPGALSTAEALLSELASDTKKIIQNPGLSLGEIGNSLLSKLNTLGKSLGASKLSSLFLVSVHTSRGSK